MFDRAVFLKSAVSLLAATAVPSPHPSASPNPWQLCDQNPILPYDHPLGLKMRVLDGPDFDLVKYRGNPVWINIFATWCEPCTRGVLSASISANPTTPYARIASVSLFHILSLWMLKADS